MSLAKFCKSCLKASSLLKVAAPLPVMIEILTLRPIIEMWPERIKGDQNGSWTGCISADF